MNLENKSIEISYEVINGIYVIKDMRQHPPKNVGLIKPKPFDKGFHYCSSVKMGLFFSCIRGEIPKKFRTAERAWKWMEKHAIRFKDTRKYTIFNPILKWIAYTPSLFFLLRDFQLQLIFIKTAIGVLSGLYAVHTDRWVLSVGFTGLCVILVIISVIDLALFIHKWRSRI